MKKISLKPGVEPFAWNTVKGGMPAFAIKEMNETSITFRDDATADAFIKALDSHGVAREQIVVEAVK